MAGHLYAFVNELSFEGQLSLAKWADGIVQFLRSLNRVADVGSGNYSIYYLSTLYNSEVAYGLTYAAGLRTVKGEQRDEIIKLKTVMDVQGWMKIEDTGFLQDCQCQYCVGKTDVTGSSLAEAYEYDGLKNASDCVLVINLPQSISYGSTIAVTKVIDIETRSLSAVNSDLETLAALDSNGFVFKYNPKSTLHPLPEQTILNDTSLFAKTQRINMGAYLYERIGHNELWCLDTLHVDGAAHFEIFSMANDTWKGECCDLQAVSPNYNSKKHKGSKIRER